MDDIDRATERAEENLSDALAVRKPVGPQPNGYCHYCQADLVGEQRWCDPECYYAWEYEQQCRARNK